MSRSFCCAICMAVFAGCVASDSPTGIATSGSTDFFPLKVGNKWYYSRYMHGVPADTTRVTHVVEVISATESVQRPIYMMLNWYFQEGSDSIWTVDTSYFMIEGDSLLSAYKDSAGFQFAVDAIFTLNNGAEFTREIGRGVNTAHFRVTVVEKNDSTITFFYDEPNWADEEHQVTYKRGKGIVDSYSTAWGIGERLVKAELK